jgi:hypothetical protein
VFLENLFSLPKMPVILLENSGGQTKANFASQKGKNVVN